MWKRVVPKTADQERGLYRKFHVERTDGGSAPGARHDGCEYFVLDLDHDPFALAALSSYAMACREQYPALAADLDSKVGRMWDGQDDGTWPKATG